MRDTSNSAGHSPFTLSFFCFATESSGELVAPLAVLVLVLLLPGHRVAFYLYLCADLPPGITAAHSRLDQGRTCCSNRTVGQHGSV